MWPWHLEMRMNVPRSLTPVTLTFAGVTEPFLPQWESLRRKHAGWFKSFGNEGRWYALPSRAVIVLAQPGSGGGRPVIPVDAVKAELDLCELSENFNGIGIWQVEPIKYPHLYLRSPGLPPSEEEMQAIGFTKAQQQAAVLAFKKVDEVAAAAQRNHWLFADRPSDHRRAAPARTPMAARNWINLNGPEFPQFRRADSRRRSDRNADGLVNGAIF